MIVLVNITGFSLRGYWPSTVEKTAPLSKQKAIAEVVSLRRVLHLMVCGGRQCRAIAAALSGAGKLSGTGCPLVPVPIGRFSSAWTWRASCWAITRLGLLLDGSTK